MQGQGQPVVLVLDLQVQVLVLVLFPVLVLVLVPVLVLVYPDIYQMYVPLDVYYSCLGSLFQHVCLLHRKEHRCVCL